MPTLSVERDILFAYLNDRTYTDEEFDELCFAFGIELDDVTSEREEAAANSNRKLSKAELSKYSETVVYKLDIPANRYDLLCVEGLSRALLIFLEDMKEAPVYRTVEPTASTTPITMTVHQDNCKTIRPFIVCAVLRNVSFSEPNRYHSFLDLQDQLHRNLCRQRTLVAIGTHDLDAVPGPHFVYDAKPATDISFVPLTPNDQGEFNAKALMEFYTTDASCKHLKPYVPIIQDSPLVPVVTSAADGTVLSLPPIINGHASRITKESTKNVFIECTATDLTKANIVLDTMVTMFSQYCGEPFTVEPVTVNYVDASGATTNSYVTPQLHTRTATASVATVNSLIGIDITAAQMVELCTKVQLGPAKAEGDVLHVTVPPTRSDILHPVDIAEDIGIAYGYNKIVKRIPTTATVGGEHALNQATDLLRDEIARAGYTEVLTHGLCSWKDMTENLGRSQETTEAVQLLNPANIEYQVVRTTLLPGLLKCIQHNRSRSFRNGMLLFEISDVVLVDAESTYLTDTKIGCRNQRTLAATYSGPTAGFEILHGLVDRIMGLLEIANAKHEDTSSLAPPTRDGWSYRVEEYRNENAGDGLYFGGRAAQVVVTSPQATTTTAVGTFGVIHPNVLDNFDIPYPTSCVELNLEALL